MDKTLKVVLIVLASALVLCVLGIGGCLLALGSEESSEENDSTEVVDENHNDTPVVNENPDDAVVNEDVEYKEEPKNEKVEELKEMDKPKPKKDETKVIVQPKESTYENNGKIFAVDDAGFSQICIDLNTKKVICPVPFIIYYFKKGDPQCKQQTAILKALQKEYDKKIQIFAAEETMNPTSTQLFEHNEVPFMVYVDMNEKKHSESGLTDEATMRQNIETYLHVK